MVSTTLGDVRGAVEGEAIAYRGIPYAAPPVDELRWAAPQPPQSWEGERDGSESGPACAQPAGQLEIESVTEDCLYLDITRPAEKGADLPVMVWLHGGSLQTGSGAQYGAASLAERGDVIVVTINYRLGPLGFFSLPRMPGPAGAFGLADQQAALRFVQEHIGAFGGDPNNVTLFGESGGAVSVCAQLTAPGAAGLFDRAIMQSAVGACGDPIEPGGVATNQPEISNFASRAQVDSAGEAAAAALGCTDSANSLECLRKLPVQALLAVGASFILPAFEEEAEAVLPDSPRASIERGEVHRVPVLAGFTSEEASFLLAQEVSAGRPDVSPEEYPLLAAQDYGADAEAALARYPLEDYASPNAAWIASRSDSAWACPALVLSDLLAQETTVYAYEFANSTAPPPTPFPPSVPQGATHGAELAFLFGFRDAEGASVEDPSWTGDQQALSDEMIDSWASFARTGRVEGPVWNETHTGLLVDESIETADLWARNQCEFWNAR